MWQTWLVWQSTSICLITALGLVILLQVLCMVPRLLRRKTFTTEVFRFASCISKRRFLRSIRSLTSWTLANMPRLSSRILSFQRPIRGMLRLGNVRSSGMGGSRRLNSEKGRAASDVLRLPVFMHISHSLLTALGCCLRVVMTDWHGWSLVGRVVQALSRENLVFFVHMGI